VRRALLLWAALAPAAHAQVVECPKFYPWQDTPLAEVPYQHRGQGFVAKSVLRGAVMYTGEINGKAALVGEPHKVKGGQDVRHGFEPGERKWLVCSYGDGSVTWWEQMDPKATSCVVQMRDGGRDPMNVKATCR
jgi:hypothetical protein